MMLMSCFWAKFLEVFIGLLFIAAAVGLAFFIMYLVEEYSDWLSYNGHNRWLFLWGPLIAIIVIGIPLIAAVAHCS